MQKKTGKQPIVFLIFYNIRFIHCSMLQHKITILSPSDHSKNNKHQNIDPINVIVIISFGLSFILSDSLLTSMICF